MTKRMLVDASHPEETRVVVLDGSRLEELDFEIAARRQLKGNIYLAKVTRVEPSLQAAFVEYGGNRHGFLAFSEVHPDYFRIPVADREALVADQVMRSARLDDDEAGGDSAGEDGDAAKPAKRGRRRRGRKADAESLADRLDGEPTADETPEDETPSEEAPDEAASAEPPAETEDGDGAPEATGFDPTPFDPTPFDPAPFSRRDSDDAAEPDAASAQDAADLADDDDGDVDDDADEDEPEDAAEARGDAPDEDEDDAEDAPAGRRVETVGGDDVDEAAQRRPPPPRRHYKIQEVIKRRQIMLVQVTKEERGNKGAALTTYLSLAGRYCVLMPNTPRGGGISRKISNPKERKRMKAILDAMDLPEGMAVILRTAGLERTKAEIKRDLDYLLRLWDSIRELTLKSTAPMLIHEEANLIKRAERDLYAKDIDEVIVAGEDGYRVAKDFMRMLMPSHAKKVKPYRDESVPLFHRYQVEGQIDAMHSPVVQLRSGGYIVLSPTEALVAIDVNSGRSTRERNIEETAYRTNLEAADEIARQLRLRDLAGLIVIDFIDMDDDRHNAAVERRLKEAMKADRARIQVGRISAFGLLELSRQRLRPSLTETHFDTCPHCGGSGLIRSVGSSALRVLRAVEEEALKRRAGGFTVRLPTNVGLYVLNQKRDALAEMEQRHGIRVWIEQDDSLIRPDFALERAAVRPEQAARPLVDFTAIMANADPALAEEDEAEESAPAGDGDAERRSKRPRRGRRRDDGKETAKDGTRARRSAEETDEADAPVDADAEARAAGPDGDEDGDAAGDAQKKKRRRGKRGGRRRNAQRQDAAETEDMDAEADSAEADGAEAEGAEPTATESDAAETEPAPTDDSAADADEDDWPALPEATLATPEPVAPEPVAPESVAQLDPAPVTIDDQPIAVAVDEPDADDGPADAPVAATTDEPADNLADADRADTADAAPEPPPERPRKGWWQRLM